jgi:hypothetical protein
MKHADNCAPTLLKFQDEADSASRTKKESKADVRWLKLEVNKEESKPHPIYPVVRHCPHDL